MAVTTGKLADVAESSSDSSYTEIGEIVSASRSFSNDTAESTSNDSGGYKTREYTNAEQTLSVTCRYDKTDTGQAAVIAAAEAKTKLWLRYRPKASSGEFEWRASHTIDSYEISADNDGIDELTFTATSDGTITKATQ